MFYKFLSYNVVIVCFKLLSSFVISKVSAVFLGPSGYALIGNFRNIFQIVTGITAVGFQSGTIKHIAELEDDRDFKTKVISTLFALSLGLSIVVGITLFVLSTYLSLWTFETIDYSYVFKYLGVLLPLISINFLVLYITNGFQKIKSYTKLVVLFSLVNAVVTVMAIYLYNLAGALIALIITSVITLFFSCIIRDIRQICSSIVFTAKTVSVKIIKSLSTYLVMAIYSTILISSSYLLIRKEIIESFGEINAGYWEAMNKISMFYMVFFTSVFTLYLLPNLAKNNTLSGYKLFMVSYFKKVIPLMLLLFLTIFLLRFFAIRLFLTNEFLEIEQFFALQLVGDFIKIIGFSLAYQFHAKKMVKYYFITDGVIYISFYFLSLFLLTKMNLIGVFYAHILSSSLYLIAVSFFIFTRNKKYLIADKK